MRLKQLAALSYSERGEANSGKLGQFMVFTRDTGEKRKFVFKLNFDIEIYGEAALIFSKLGCLSCNQSVFSQWNYLTFAVRPKYYRRPNNGLEDISREHDGKQTLGNPPWVTYSYFHFGMLLLEMAQIAFMVGIYISILAY